jgi:AraC-like DNA-binding protein
MSVADNTDGPEPTRIVLDSQQLGAEQYNDILHDTIKPLADLNTLKAEDGAPTSANSGSLQLQTFGELVFFRLRSTNLIYTRGRKQIATGDTDDFYIVGAFHIGTNIVSTEQNFVVRAGDSVILDLAHPLAGHYLTSADNTQIVVPKRALQQHGFDMKGSEGLHLSGSTPNGAMLHSALLSMGESLKNATPDQALAASNSLPGLISHLMAPVEHSADSPAVRSATLAEMMGYIEQHLFDSKLSVSSLVKTFHTSRSAVYRLFADEGGVAAYIQRRRLHACYRELTIDPSPSKRIIDIALKWGFNSHSHFSHIFRENYGLTPSSLQEAALANELGRVNRQAELYIDSINRKIEWMFNQD